MEKIIKALGILASSILLWVLFLIPRIVISLIRFVKSILFIVEDTLTHLIKTIQSEVLK